MQNLKKSQYQDNIRQRQKARFRPSFKLVMVGTHVTVTRNEAGVPVRKLETQVVKEIPLFRGLDLEAAQKSCDMMQEEYDEKDSTVRVYLHSGNDPVPVYASFAKVS